MRKGSPSARRIVPVLLLPQLTFAAGADEKSAPFQASPLGTGVLTETAMALIAIIALIFVLSWFFRRFGRHTLAGKGMVSVVGGVSLGPRERAVLLQVGGTRLLVGVAPGQVRMLHVLEREAEAEVSEAGFDGQLKREMGAES